MPIQSIRKNSDTPIPFKQALRDVEKLYKDIGAYDMEYRRFKEIGCKTRVENFNYLYIDMTRDKKEGTYRIFNENKYTYFECICETEAFQIY